MDPTKQRQTLWSALPELLVRHGEKTGPSRSYDLLSKDQIAEWKTFKNEVREDTKAKNGNPEQALISPPTVDSYVVATEDGIQARFIEQICSEIGKIFEAQGISVRFADRSTGQHAITGHNPDVIIQGTSQDGKTKVAGEIKTPWTTTLMSLDSKGIRRVLGQIVRYMDRYGCRYGFVSTYRQTVFVRRMSPYRFQFSPVIMRGQDSQISPNLKVSVREAFYFLARVASRADWKYHGKVIGDTLVDGTWKASMPVRN